jgi:hypothetical protein
MIYDFSEEMQLVSRMKQIGIDIIARKLHDYMKCEPIALKAIPGFNTNVESYEMLGPVFDNDFGMLFTFQMKSLLNFDLDPPKWK